MPDANTYTNTHVTAHTGTFSKKVLSSQKKSRGVRTAEKARKKSIQLLSNQLVGGAMSFGTATVQVAQLAADESSDGDDESSDSDDHSDSDVQGDKGKEKALHGANSGEYIAAKEKSGHSRGSIGETVLPPVKHISSLETLTISGGQGPTSWGSSSTSTSLIHSPPTHLPTRSGSAGSSRTGNTGNTGNSSSAGNNHGQRGSRPQQPHRTPRLGFIL